MKSTEIDSCTEKWFMEKRLYTDRRTLYINDRPVSEYRFGNLRYGEPETYKVSIEDFKKLYSVVEYYGCFSLPVKFYRGLRKIKVDGTTFRREDVKSMYLLGQSEEIKEDRSNILELAKKLTVPEFVEFCKDKGLSVKVLREEKIYN